MSLIRQQTVMFTESEVEQYSVSSGPVRIGLMVCKPWLSKYDVLPTKLCYKQTDFLLVLIYLEGDLNIVMNRVDSSIGHADASRFA